MDQSPLEKSSEDMNPDKPPEQGDEPSEPCDPNVPEEDSEEAMQIRKNRIMNIIKNWKGGPIVIEDVTEEPKSRKNILVAFEALVYLDCEDYVRLQPDENSVLNIIEKGVNFDRYAF